MPEHWKSHDPENKVQILILVIKYKALDNSETAYITPVKKNFIRCKTLINAK